MSPPTISVILPTYNRQALLAEAVASVRAQTFPDWELIVVDDGSTDQTAAVLESMIDPRLRVVHIAHTGNRARVRNTGVAAASGKYLAFIDDDDLWLPGKLAAQLAAMRDAGTGWSYTAAAYVPLAGGPVRQAEAATLKSGFVLRDLLALDIGISTPAVVAERSLVVSAGMFDESLGRGEDFALWCSIAECAAVTAVPERLTIVRTHVTVAERLEGLAWIARLLRMWIRRTPDPELRSVCRRSLASLQVMAASHHLSLGQWSRMTASLIAAFIADPGSTLGRLTGAVRRRVLHEGA